MSGANTAVYPVIQDWDAFIASLTPAPAFLGDSATFLQVLAWPWSVLELDLEQLAIGLVDLDAAVTWVIDVAGKRVNERRQGLDDTEYRRIVAGKRLAIGSGGSASDVWAVLLGLTSADSGRLLVAENESTGETGVIMWGTISFVPSETFLMRAGQVLRAALPLAAEATCSLATSQTAVFDGASFDDGGLFGYALPLE